ncbi:hypothetical protein B0H19DRAFT_199568 [Mycena capillaripes]|nr:hypothetical protein B0H19DRAFT_199568 [Mycena capillaripes]
MYAIDSLQCFRFEESLLFFSLPLPLFNLPTFYSRCCKIRVARIRTAASASASRIAFRGDSKVYILSTRTEFAGMGCTQENSGPRKHSRIREENAKKKKKKKKKKDLAVWMNLADLLLLLPLSISCSAYPHPR